MIFIYIGLIVFGLFAFVILFGAPYLPTRKEQIDDALKLLDLKPGETLIELGSGDGRVLRAAAKKGIKSVGYELNPLLAGISKIVNFKYRRLVRTKCGSLWGADVSKADGIYTFLLDKYMLKLDKKLLIETKGGAKFVSFAFKIPNKKVKKRSKGLFLYIYR